ncbi:MAG: hypothetical protein GY910_11370 [bacterium]|nr:hypothetical protein [Deltaproteobacteria bacterium]MCP4905570.1 hypothetical protein [bacterium]
MSNPVSASDASQERSLLGQAESDGRRCDFCGDRVAAVRRVALDVEYDRLQKAHREQYSCADCFEAKEEQRLGMTHR